MPYIYIIIKNKAMKVSIQKSSIMKQKIINDLKSIGLTQGKGKWNNVSFSWEQSRYYMTLKGDYRLYKVRGCDDYTIYAKQEVADKIRKQFPEYEYKVEVV